MQSWSIFFHHQPSQWVHALSAHGEKKRRGRSRDFVFPFRSVPLIRSMTRSREIRETYGTIPEFQTVQNDLVLVITTERHSRLVDLTAPDVFKREHTQVGSSICRNDGVVETRTSPPNAGTGIASRADFYLLFSISARLNFARMTKKSLSPR